MVFKCQEDSFLREFSSKVVSCDKAQFVSIIDSKETKLDGYEVIFEDTVLFPEGGGQPSDHGYLNDQEVKQVIRKADKAVHFVQQPFEIGEEVKQVVNWERRLDHMQQHSGQHLLSAILEKEFSAPTDSWYLGEDTAYVELDVPSITLDQIKAAEQRCNELIREARTVVVHIYNENTPDEDLENFRSTRGLPADHKGDIRVIIIEGIDSNMCCGTHVTNLSQLQVIKLLHTEKSKRKNKILLHFLVGNRVIDRLDKCINQEQKLVGLLKTNPKQHGEFVEKLIDNCKALKKKLQSVLKDLATIEAVKVKNSCPKYFILHQKEAEVDFVHTFVRELGTTETFLFLAVGDKENCYVVMIGDEKALSDLGTKICDVLGGKGAKHGNKLQAKVTKISKLEEAAKMVEQYFS